MGPAGDPDRAAACKPVHTDMQPSREQVLKANAELQAVVQGLAESNRMLVRSQRVLEMRLETERREMQRVREESTRLALAKEEFLANMSHELRTPLNAIIGFSDAILSGVIVDGCPPRCQDYVEDIRGAGSHLLTLVNDMLDVAQSSLALRQEPVDIRRVVHFAAETLSEPAERSQVEIDNRVVEPIPPLMADAARLKKVLVNLLDNALKFTPPGGRVVVEAAADPERGLTLTITDTGVGISAENLPLVLAPFGQLEGVKCRRHHGTGMGLPLSRQLIEAQGGNFHIESLPNAGTTITIRFPSSLLAAAA